MKIYLTTDTHFGHDLLIERGFRPDGYEKKILKKFWCVEKEDILIHLGDFCIGNDAKHHKMFFDKVKCRTNVLVRGNHDRKSDSWYYRNGWDFVANEIHIRSQGKLVCLSHCPINGSFDMNIHGHFHDDVHRYDKDFDAFYNNEIHKLFALEWTNYAPVLLSSFVDKPEKYVKIAIKQ